MSNIMSRLRWSDNPNIAQLLEPPKPKWGKPGRPKAEPKAPNIPVKRGAQRKKAK